MKLQLMAHHSDQQSVAMEASAVHVVPACIEKNEILSAGKYHKKCELLFPTTKSSVEATVDLFFIPFTCHNRLAVPFFF
jgi:hypothetical protein